MKRSVFLIFLTLAGSILPGCVGVTQTISTPTSAPTIPSLPSPQASAPAPQATSPRATPTPGGGTVITDPTLVNLINQAKADLTTRANVAPDATTVVSAEPAEWSDSSLGCPEEGMMYAQVITPGYLIVLEANGQQYNYHASMNRVMYCDK